MFVPSARARGACITNGTRCSRNADRSSFLDVMVTDAEIRSIELIKSVVDVKRRENP